MQRTLPVIQLPKAPSNLKDLPVWAQKLTQQLQSHFYDVVTTMNSGAQGIGPDLPAAPSITPTAYLHQITGTAAISTINNPNGASSAIVLKSKNGFMLVPGGNIDVPQPVKVTAPNYAQLVYHADTKMWNVTNTGGPFSAPSITAHALLVGEGTNPINALGPLTDGQLVIGISGADPVAAALAAALGIQITTGPGSVSIKNTGIITVTGTPNEILVTAGQNPVISLPATITGPTKITGLTAPSAAGDALSADNPVARSYMFANLPATPATGQLAIVTDSNTAVWGANVAAGGANTVLAWFNGTNWTVLGK